MTAGLSWLESGHRQATVGKRVRQLVVVGAESAGRVGLGRALLRNSLKIGVPWVIGHVAVYGIVGAGPTGVPPVWVWIVTGLAYAVPIVWLVGLFVGRGRPLYDRIAGTAVVTGSR